MVRRDFQSQSQFRSSLSELAWHFSLCPRLVVRYPYPELEHVFILAYEPPPPAGIDPTENISPVSLQRTPPPGARFQLPQRDHAASDVDSVFRPRRTSNTQNLANLINGQVLALTLDRYQVLLYKIRTVSGQGIPKPTTPQVRYRKYLVRLLLPLSRPTLPMLYRRLPYEDRNPMHLSEGIERDHKYHSSQAHLNAQEPIAPPPPSRIAAARLHQVSSLNLCRHRIPAA